MSILRAPRSLLWSVLLVLLLYGSGAVPAAERRGQSPTVSADLKQHSKRSHTHRVIVQGPESVLGDLTPKLLRRLAKGGTVVLEVDDAELDALERNPMLWHLSGDLPVSGDLAVTNRVT